MLFNLRVQLDNVQPFSGVFTSNLAWYVTPSHYYNIWFPIPFRQDRPRPAAVYSIVCRQFRRLLQHSAYLKIQQNEIIIVILIKQNIVVIITFLHLHGHAIEHRVWKMIKTNETRHLDFWFRVRTARRRRRVVVCCSFLKHDAIMYTRRASS